MAHRGRGTPSNANTLHEIEVESQHVLSEKNKRLDVKHSSALSRGQIGSNAGIFELIVCAGGIYVSL